MAWSPDGSRLASGGYDRDVKIWTVDSRGTADELMTLQGHEWVVYSVAWDPGGQRLLSVDAIGGARVWDGRREGED